MVSSPFIRRWIAASTAGWVVGIACVLLIGAGAEFLGIRGQFAIGLGMGLGVGFFQWLRARRALALSPRWILSSGIGLAVPFAVCDLAGYNADGVTLIIPTAIGGVIAALAQTRELSVPLREKSLWVVSASIAWIAAAAATLMFAIHGHPSSGWQLLRQLLALVSGGVILGSVTGFVLAFLHKRST